MNKPENTIAVRLGILAVVLAVLISGCALKKPKKPASPSFTAIEYQSQRLNDAVDEIIEKQQDQRNLNSIDKDILWLLEGRGQ